MPFRFASAAGSGAAAILFLLACLLLTAVLPAPAAFAQDEGWTGVWDTRWPRGGARLTLQQDGDRVTGEYPLYGGRIEGAVEGNRLTGTWSEPRAQGTFAFVLSADGRTFMGRYSDDEWWTGARVEEARLGLGARTSQDSPRSVLRAFAVGGEAVENGQLEYLDDIMQLLIFPAADLDKTDELRETRLLWLLLDRFQVRMTDVPRNPAGDRYTLKLERHDGRTYALDFERRDGRWFILVPPEEAMEAALAALLADSKGHVPSANQVLQLRTPRDAMEAFLDAMRAGPGGLDEAISALNLSELSDVVRDREAVLLAQYLNEVLARIGEVVLQEVPNDPENEAPYFHFVHPAGDVVIAPVDTPDGRKWKFTPETLRTVRQLYAAAEDLPPAQYVLPYDPDSAAVFFRIRDMLRDILPGALTPLGPLELWQWVAMIAVFALAFLGALLVGVLVFLVRLLLHRSAEQAAARSPRLFLWGIRLLTFGLISYGGLLLLGLPDHFAGAVTTVSVLALIAGAIPLEFWLVDGIRHTLDRYGAISQRGDILASLLVGIVKVAIILGNFLLLAEALSIPYGAALAGFGIGGLAVALAARSTLENVIAGFILFADKPLAVGDYCRFGQKMGTVERIGIRSTELRTRDRTIISVPNAEFVNMHLENFGRRDRILLQTGLSLRYETSPDQLRFVLAELRKLLIAHPMVAEDPLRVRFAGFGTHSLDIDVYAYVKTRDWSEFLGVREDLFLRIMELVHGSGTGFAFPSQTMYLGRDKSLDADLVRKAEAQVRDWKAQNRLPFPNFTVEEIDGLANSLPYPPEGAPRIFQQVPEGQLAERRSRRSFWPFGRGARPA